VIFYHSPEQKAARKTKQEISETADLIDRSNAIEPAPKFGARKNITSAIWKSVANALAI